MTPSNSADALRQFFRDSAVDLSSTTCGEMLETVLAFYRTVRAKGLSKSPQNDMLLCQQGIYATLHRGFFTIGLTRQFAEYDTDDGNAPLKEDDYYGDRLSQLSCTALLPRTAVLEVLPNANR